MVLHESREVEVLPVNMPQLGGLLHAVSPHRDQRFRLQGPAARVGAGDDAGAAAAAVSQTRRFQGLAHG